MPPKKAKSNKAKKPKRVVVTSKTARTIRNTSSPAPTVSPSVVATALGAEMVGVVPAGGGLVHKIQTSSLYGKFGVPDETMRADEREPKTGPGGPRITKGNSLGIYATQMEFIRACEKKFGKIVWDLAADANNTRVPGKFFSEADDAFKQDWAATAKREGGLLWLNPPFTHIGPWAEKCLAESLLGAEILLLVPASVGSKWFQQFVFEKSDCNFLYGRLMFEGQTTVYPKDCMLVHFTNDVSQHGIHIWEWRKELKEEKAA